MNALASLSVLRDWPPRRFAVAVAATVASVLAVAIPTAMIATPLFGREIPPTWWSWPALIISSVLAGVLIATYVRDDDPVMDDETAARRSGTVGGILTFFAVGCPVCNKLVLIALGSAGAITWFEPVQPVLQLIAIGLLTWALLKRLEGERSCSLTPAPISVDA